jgi:hypothetical protein
MTMGSIDALESRLAGRLAGRLAARAQYPSGSWVSQIASWRALADLCLELDDVLNLASVETAEMTALHRAVLNLGVGTGEWLLHELRTNHVELSRSNESLEHLEALLELLRICFESRHAEVSRAEMDAIQRTVFNVST